MSPKDPIHELLSAQGIMPQEAMVWTKQNAQSLLIGVPKEVSDNENRCPLSPNAVQLLISNGHQVRIEAGAGNKAGFSDASFLMAGASIHSEAKEVWECPLILKLTPPTLNEIAWMKPGACVFSCAANFLLHPDVLDALLAKQITGLGMEYVQDNAGGYPFVHSMAEIAGQLILPIASHYLSHNPQGGQLLGNVSGVPPIQMVFLGAGHVVEQAARAAWHSGIQFQVFDKDLYKLQRLKQSLGLPLVTQVIDSENLPLALQQAHVIVGALRSENGITPCIVTEEMVSKLKPGTLIIDVCIDQGGCFETSELTTLNHPVFSKYEVLHYCVPNIPSKVGKTASNAISNLLTSFVLKAGKTGGLEEMLWQGKSFMKGVYCYKGHVTLASVSKFFKKPLKDIQVLLLKSSS